MDNISTVLKRLKKFSLLLFIFPSVALVFSLLIHNYLVSFIYSPQAYYQSASASFTSIICDKKNDFCFNLNEIIKVKKNNNDLFDCKKNKVNIYYNYNGSYYDQHEIGKVTKKEEFVKNKLLDAKFLKSDDKNLSCIKNSNFYFLYKNFTNLTNFIYKFKNNENFSFGTSKIVNPFFFGETSISNIVKRLPLAYFFKPLIYLSSFFMIAYWYYNNLAAQKIQNVKKNFKFFYFGILSSIFLFLHVTFLGLSIDNNLFQKFRRLVMVLFILFEIISQVLLVVNLKKNLEKYKKYIFINILSLKYILINFMVIATILILFILTFFDLSSRFDYFLEWNYFLILLFFYLLSFFLWKISTNR